MQFTNVGMLKFTSKATKICPNIPFQISKKQKENIIPYILRFNIYIPKILNFEKQKIFISNVINIYIYI